VNASPGPTVALDGPTHILNSTKTVKKLSQMARWMNRHKDWHCYANSEKMSVNV